jgi:hypothetical protein
VVSRFALAAGSERETVNGLRRGSPPGASLVDVIRRPDTLIEAATVNKSIAWLTRKAELSPG